MRLKELIGKLNAIQDDYNHSNPNIIIRIGGDAEIGKITDVADVEACNEAMGCGSSIYDNCLEHPNHNSNDDCFVDKSRIDNDNEVSRLYEIEILVEEL